MTRIVLFNKPFDVLSQFGDREAGRRTCKDFVPVPGIYPAGRLDRDSEGLLVLTDDGGLIARIASPKFKRPKVYWAQVEGIPDDAALERLRQGITLNDGPTLPVTARVMAEPDGLWPRDPPIRYRAAIPTSWIELTLREGRNRQVRRMTAAIGFPTLRLIRWAVGDWDLAGLAPGEWREVAAGPASADPAGKRITSRSRSRRDGSCLP